MAIPATNNHPRIRLLVADIDGTLVTKRSVQAIQKLGEASIWFGVTTGRPPAGVKMLIERLPNLNFIAGFNGGVIVRSQLFGIQAESVRTGSSRAGGAKFWRARLTCGSKPRATGLFGFARGNAVPAWENQFHRGGQPVARAGGVYENWSDRSE